MRCCCDRRRRPTPCWPGRRRRSSSGSASRLSPRSAALSCWIGACRKSPRSGPSSIRPILATSSCPSTRSNRGSTPSHGRPFRAPTGTKRGAASRSRSCAATVCRPMGSRPDLNRDRWTSCPISLRSSRAGCRCWEAFCWSGPPCFAGSPWASPKATCQPQHVCGSPARAWARWDSPLAAPRSSACRSRGWATRRSGRSSCLGPAWAR